MKERRRSSGSPLARLTSSCTSSAAFGTDTQGCSGGSASQGRKGCLSSSPRRRRPCGARRTCRAHGPGAPGCRPTRPGAALDGTKTRVYRFRGVAASSTVALMVQQAPTHPPGHGAAVGVTLTSDFRNLRVRTGAVARETRGPARGNPWSSAARGDSSLLITNHEARPAWHWPTRHSCSEVDEPFEGQPRLVAASASKQNRPASPRHWSAGALSFLEVAALILRCSRRARPGRSVAYVPREWPAVTALAPLLGD